MSNPNYDENNIEHFLVTAKELSLKLDEAKSALFAGKAITRQQQNEIIILQNRIGNLLVSLSRYTPEETKAIEENRRRVNEAAAPYRSALQRFADDFINSLKESGDYAPNLFAGPTTTITVTSSYSEQQFYSGSEEIELPEALLADHEDVLNDFKSELSDQGICDYIDHECGDSEFIDSSLEIE